ncbi:MAG TPA: nucleotidyl transferase AbiEii/AbiGii toxin family protein [Micromonosporaceae bacterium]|nr:nucleotidyl transferase AbiEii/AbiGii toxin family protein [Micromonosporaceae bacterium]
MDPDPFQLEIARLALDASARHGFALAGGQALIAHGIVARPTTDVDLFTDVESGVAVAAGPVAAALAAAGMSVEPVAEEAGVEDMFDGFDVNLAEFVVSRGPDVARLQLVYFGRSRAPVAMAVGPVLDLVDVVGGKAAALATRAELRDLIDVAAILRRFSRAEIMTLARRADPALTDEEFADAVARLDRVADATFTEVYGVTAAEVAKIRDAFADWPRP